MSRKLKIGDRVIDNRPFVGGQHGVLQNVWRRHWPYKDLYTIKLDNGQTVDTIYCRKAPTLRREKAA
jgi:hypothetical protein